MKDKVTISLTIGFVCFLLTALIFIQFKTITQTDITLIENMRDEEVRTEITKYKTRIEEIVKKTEETKIKTIEYANTIKKDQETTKLLAIELKQLKDLLGKNDVYRKWSNSNLKRYKRSTNNSRRFINIIKSVKRSRSRSFINK